MLSLGEKSIYRTVNVVQVSVLYIASEFVCVVFALGLNTLPVLSVLAECGPLCPALVRLGIRAGVAVWKWWYCSHLRGQYSDFSSYTSPFSLDGLSGST